MPRMVLVLPLVAGLVALGAGAHLRSFALVFLGLTLLCLAPIGLRRMATPATVAASVFATLAILEAALAVLRPAESPASTRIAERYREGMAMTDLGPLPAAGAYPIREVSRDGETLFDVTYTIGPDGFRVTPATPDDEAGRLDLFGCSFAFGEGLEDDETLAFALARSLGAEAANFGIIGGGPHQALALFESDVESEAEVNVLLTAPWHAQRVACKPSWSGGAPRFRLAAGGPVRDGVCPAQGAEPLHRALRHSRVFEVAETAYRVLRRESTTEAEIDLYVAVIARLAELSRQRGQDFVIAYIGADQLNGLPLDNAALTRRLEAATGAVVVDVSLAESAAALAPEYYIHELDRHPSALANAARAELLVPVLATMLKE